MLWKFGLTSMWDTSCHLRPDRQPALLTHGASLQRPSLRTKRSHLRRSYKEAVYQGTQVGYGTRNEPRRAWEARQAYIAANAGPK